MKTIEFYKPNNDESIKALNVVERRIISFIEETSQIDDILEADIDELIDNEFMYMRAEYGDPWYNCDFPQERYEKLFEIQWVRNKMIETQFQPKTYEEIVEFIKRRLEIQFQPETYNELIEFVKRRLENQFQPKTYHELVVFVKSLVKFFYVKISKP